MLLLSCQEKMVWHVKESERKLIVEGSLTDEFKKQQIRLSVSGDYCSENPPTAVHGASIKVFDGTQQIIFKERNDLQGFYESEFPVAGVPGRTYVLDVQLSSPVGKEDHYTALTSMGNKFDYESLELMYKEALDDEEEKKVNYCLLFLSGKEAKSKGDYYYLRIFKNHQLLTDTVREFIQINDDTYDINGRSGIISWYQLEDSINSEVDSLTIEINSVTKEYSSFLNELEESTVEPDPFGMAGPPANVKGNISGGALGYFIAASVGRKTAKIESFDLEKAEHLKRKIQNVW